MNEDYCDYKLSLALKEAGFDEPCDSYYDKACASDDEYWHTKREELYNWNGLDSDCQISAPTLWQAQKWLREEWGIAINVIAHDYRDKYVESKFHWNEVFLSDIDRSGEQWRKYFIFGRHPLFDTYEEALSDGLSQMLELIKKGE